MTTENTPIPTTFTPRNATVIQLGLLAFVFLFSILLFTFSHEGGHALVGLLFGAKLTSFSVDFIGMSAHVGLDASFSNLQQSIVSLAGFMTPYLLVMALLLSVPRRGNALLEWVKVLTAIISISSLLAWVVLPWFYLAGVRPGDDSITFILHSGIHPALVSAGAALIFGVGLAVLSQRTEGLKGILSRMRAGAAEFITPAARRTLAVMALVFACVAGLSFGLGAVFGTENTAFLTAPAGFTRVMEIRLSQRGYADEAVYSFTLEQPSSVSLFFAMQGLTRGPAKIALAGPNGYNNVFFIDGEKAAGNFTVAPRDLPLEAGSFQVVLTFPQNPGVLVISQKIESR